LGMAENSTSDAFPMLVPREPSGAALAAVGIAAPIVLERRYRLLVDALVRLRRSRRGQWSVAAGSGVIMAVLALLAARHFATSSWPLAGGQPGVLVAICLLLLLAQGFKAWGWGRLFAADERPRSLALAAGNGGAALIGVVLPGRFDDAMRVAVVRRDPGCRAGVRALCLSLVMLGLIDSVALAPLAAAAAVLGGGIGVRAGLTVVAVAGVAAAGLLLVLPRFAGSKRALRFRLGRWLSPRTTSKRRLSEAWALVSACWLLRAVASFLLLGTLGVGFSFSLALLFLCAGAAAAAVPIGPAGAATQVGAGAAALIASGVGGSQALAVTLAGGALGVLTGAAIFLAAIAWRVGLSLADRRMDEPVEQLGHIPARGKEAQHESSGLVLQPQQKVNDSLTCDTRTRG
jgi:Lysylphosphatidylglycerol synthase TM region